jgi:hypothetical protein
MFASLHPFEKTVASLTINARVKKGHRSLTVGRTADARCSLITLTL